MMDEARAGIREVVLDDRWDALEGMAIDRRAAVYRATSDELERRRADAAFTTQMARIAKLERDTLAREASGDWQADWSDLVAAAFPEVARSQPKPNAARSGANVR